MVVDYAVTVAVDAAGVSHEQLDYLTLQSNRVETSYQEVKERPTVVHTISEVKNFVTEALQNNELEAGKTMTALSQNSHAPVLYFLFSQLFHWHCGEVFGETLAGDVHAGKGRTSKCHIK